MVHAIRVVHGLLLALFLAGGAGIALAQGVTDQDRLAAQCIGIEEETIANSQGEARSASQARLAAFQRYLTVRGYGPGGSLAHAMPSIEAARQSGRSDGRDCLREQRTCARVCGGNAVCVMNCVGSASACTPVTRCAEPGVVPP